MSGGSAGVGRPRGNQLVEVRVMRKLLSILVAVAVSAPLLTAFGCAENGNKPYSLTGEQGLTADQKRWVDQHSIDEKGHYYLIKHQQALAQVRSANSNANANGR
jgi:hypothetical protein